MIHNASLLTPAEVAKYLRVNKYTIYRLVSEKKLPAIKVGNQLRFKANEIETWLGQNSSVAPEP